MARLSIWSFAWIAYLVFWVLWVFLIPRFVPQVNGYGFFLPFFFFFPFFRRRRGTRARPVATPSVDNEKRKQEDYSYENTVMAEEIGPHRSTRNTLLYLTGAVIIVAGTFLILSRYFM